jgi:hypothetical protein
MPPPGNLTRFIECNLAPQISIENLIHLPHQSRAYIYADAGKK